MANLSESYNYKIRLSNCINAILASKSAPLEFGLESWESFKAHGPTQSHETHKSAKSCIWW